MSSNMPASLANGRYQLGQLVGRGGMAEVRVALDTRLGRTVAIKIMRADLANDKIFLSRFRREAHSVAQMNNPNIVNIYDSGEETVMTDSGGTERLPGPGVGVGQGPGTGVPGDGVRQGPDAA